MSVLVKNVEMPKNCCECFACKSNLGGPLFCKAKWVAFGKEDAEWLLFKTPDWCPLVEIKTPHGDLIDIDTATVQMTFNTEEPVMFRIEGDVIIEAEE